MTTASPTQRVNAWLARLDTALKANAVQEAAGLFAEDSYWRDFVSFTWNLKTMEGRQAIRGHARGDAAQRPPVGLDSGGRGDRTGGITEAWIRFETAVGRGKGHVRLNAATRLGRCSPRMVRTQGPRGAQGPDARQGRAAWQRQKHRQNWLERKQAESKPRSGYRAALRGHRRWRAGRHRPGRAAEAAWACRRSSSRRTPRPGDSWRNRYKSLCLHDPVWYDHMPYLPFPDHWPVFSPKDKIGDWLEMYTKVMELNYWGSTVCKRAPTTTGPANGPSWSCATASR
jgi:putative flavoprotein involved in K+ transport